MKKAMQSICFILVLLIFGKSYAGCLSTVVLESPNARFILNENVVIDTHTGLHWQRCPIGQIWYAQKKRCTLDPKQKRLFSWKLALKEAQENRLNDFSDWRLPNKNELSSIVERACSGPAINEEVFPGTNSAEFWTSTPGRREGGYAWRVNFKTGDLINIYMDTELGIRLVRN